MKAVVQNLHVIVDTREQTPPPFPEGVTTERRTLSEGDYTTQSLLGAARIERKGPGDFVASLTHERERFDREVERLKAFRFRLVVVEADLADYMTPKLSATHPHSIVGSICSLYARHGIPTLFAHDAATAGRMIAGILWRLEEEIVRPRR